MTKKFNINYTCQHCGRQTTAETAFHRWMRNNPQLDSGDGIVRTDLDDIILRYKTYPYGRDFQLMMMLEVKEYGAEPDPAQRDMLSFLSQTVFVRGKNMHGSDTTKSLKLISRMNRKKVLVRNFGMHLLQFEKTNPKDSAWIKWNRQRVNEQDLTEILKLDRRPDNPDLPMDQFLRDRHRKSTNLYLPL